MQVYELPNETKAATGFTHKAIVTHVDLTESTADTDQTIALLSVVAGDVVQKAAFQLVTAFRTRATPPSTTPTSALATVETPTASLPQLKSMKTALRSTSQPTRTPRPTPTRRPTRLTSWLRA
jgi:hypothetical protein